MPDETSSQPPTRNPDNPSPTQPIPSPIEQDVMGQGRQNDADQKPADTATLAKDIHWIHHATLWSQIGLGLIGLGALWIYNGQLSVMSGQLEQMKAASAQAKIDTAAAITAQQKIAQDALTASQQSVDKSLGATIDNFHLEQRAWVGVSTMALTVILENEPLRAEAEITNSGKTPAFKVRIDKAGIQTNYGPLDVDDFIASGKWKKPTQPRSSPTIFPNSGVKIPFHTDQNLTEMWVKQIADHVLWVYIFGDIYYRDAFGIEHMTEFCGHYDPPTRRFDGCPHHSRAT